MPIVKELRVRIAIPSTGQWDSDFGMCLVQLIMDFHRADKLVKGYDRVQALPHSKISSNLCNARNAMVMQAYEEGFHRILFLDSDQTFPPDTLRRLLAWDKTIVATNVATKGRVSNPTARGFDEKPVYTVPGISTGLEKVWQIGTGIMLINLVGKLHKMPMPWFEQQWREEKKTHEGEDWGFVRQAATFGVDAYIDHDLSQQVGHVGRWRYTHQDVQDDLKINNVAGED